MSYNWPSGKLRNKRTTRLAIQQCHDHFACPHLEGGGRGRRHRSFSVLARCPQAADGAGVGLELVSPARAVLLLKLGHRPVYKLVVEVFAAEVRIAARGLNLIDQSKSPISTKGGGGFQSWLLGDLISALRYRAVVR